MTLKNILTKSFATIGLSALILSGCPKEAPKLEPVVEEQPVIIEQPPTIKPAPKIEEPVIKEKVKGIEYNLGSTPAKDTPSLKDLPYGLKGRVLIKKYDAGEQLLSLNLQLRDVNFSKGLCPINRTFELSINELCYLDTKQGIIGIYWDIKDEGFKRSTMLHFEKVKTNDPEKNQQLIDEEEPARFVLGTTPAEQTPVIKNLPFGLEGRINIENFDSPERELTLNLRLRNIERVTERENECTIKSSMVLKQSESCYIQKDGNLIEVHWEVEQVDGVPNAVLYLE